ncbi:MAG: radical SAM protein [Bacteroidales bacterium]
MSKANSSRPTARPAPRRQAKPDAPRGWGAWQQREQARDTLSREVGAVCKPHGDRLRVALAFPNTYYVGMSNLGFQTVYRLFNALDDVVCERVFLPPKQELRAALEAGTPLVTLESQTPVSDFDILAFSVSFEWDYPNVLTLLRLSGIPLYAVDRTDRHPLIVLGGAITFLNPEPLAPFADLVAAGEGEVLVPTLVKAVGAGGGRDAVLGRLAPEPGFYVPSFYDVRYHEAGTVAEYVARPGSGASVPVHKAAARLSEGVDPPATSIFTPDTEFGSRFLVEVVRGCANLCRFCWAGYNYLPVRPFAASRILALAEAARPYATRAGLVSIALCDHPQIEEILGGMVHMGYSLSPASLRLDDLTDPIVKLLRAGGERSVTIAPETGSDRLRRVINKTVTNADILDRAELIFANGFENLKLYFMIGLPTETDEDLVAIRDLVVQLRERMLKHARSRGVVGRIVASVNPLIPKPMTAYQWLPMEQAAVVDKASRRLRGLLADLDNVYCSIKSERHSFYQALLSLGDRRVAPVIERAEQNGGAWREAVAASGIDADFYLFRDRTADAVLPWDIIDGGMKSGFLRNEYEKALRAEWTKL